VTQRHRERAIPLGLTLLSFAMAIVQAPGRTSFETKVNLHVDPTGFLSNVLSAWSPTGDLGHVQSGQYVGYLFPMGPWFAMGRLLGLPDWLVDRLWLGSILAIGAWGVVRLLDALLARGRGREHCLAGFAYVFNPYVVTMSNQTTVNLVAYAALPWLLLIVHRGLRHPRDWWWPAAFALIVVSIGGGVNAATLAWLLVGPLLLVVYEATLGVRWGAVRGFSARAIVASTGASLWWIGGVAIGGLYGSNFLPYVEQPGTIWQTTSVSEALRGMGYWVTYTGVPQASRALPVLTSAPTMLFNRPVLVASLLVPALALAGFVWTRRLRYGPFFLALVLVGVGIVAAGFPEGTPLRAGLHFVYNHFAPVRFLRTSYKAEPLVMLGVAALFGIAWGEASRRLARRRLAPGVQIGVGLALLVVGAWPLTTGKAVGLTSRGVPAAWRQAATALDRELPPNSRALVLPGQLFSYYTWGGTVDPILPVLSSRPVAQRSITPFADLHATDLLWTVDRLVEQQRLYPGQLKPLLALMGVRAVVTGSDDDRLKSGSLDPTIAATELAAQGLRRSARRYGPETKFPAPADETYPPMTLPEVRRYDLPSSRGIVSVDPSGPPTIVDGSAEALAGLAAFGELPADNPIFYAGDLSGFELRGLTASGAQVVVSDTNRRRVFVNSIVDQNLGPTVGAGDSFSADAAVLDPFAARGANAQTAQVLTGARYIRAPYSPGFAQFPEHRPFAAFDGSPSTAWLADHNLAPSQHYIEIGFNSRRNVPFIDLLPYEDSRGAVVAVEIAGRRFAIRPGWNRIALGLRHVSSLRVLIAKVRVPAQPPAGAGGFSEIRIPGVHVTEALRVPVLAERALTGQALARVSLSYLFERTTGDDPLRRMRGHGAWQAASVADAGDGETGLRRLVTPPAARVWSAAAWLSLSPLTRDSELDRLAGYDGTVTADSSGRFLNEGRFRASSAFDGSAATAWLGELDPGSRPWISWSLPRSVTVSRLHLALARFPVLAPARVSLSSDGHSSGPIPVAPDGTVHLPSAIHGRRFVLTVLATRLPPGVPRGALARRAVGIGEISGAGVPLMRIPRRGPLRAGCGIVRFRVGTRVVQLRVDGDVQAVDSASALPARQCGSGVRLPAGQQLLSAGSGVFRIDWLLLRSAAPDPAAGAVGGGRVLAAGHVGQSSVTGVRVALHGPSWLVLGESYNRGWRARCDGRSLGIPVVINGYANGWRAPPSCRAVDFTFAPQRVMVWLYVLSAVAILVLVALLVLRRPPVRTETRAGPLPVEQRPRPMRPLSAAAVGVAAGVVLGFIFSIHSGVVIAPAVALICWRGIGARPLTIAAGLLLALVVPAIYLAAPPTNLGGYNSNYAIDLIWAHWAAVAAVVLLTLALARTLLEARYVRAERTSTT
jgi:arabinofuranan 3-O-arabinosyltransferase